MDELCQKLVQTMHLFDLQIIVLKNRKLFHVDRMKQILRTSTSSLAIEEARTIAVTVARTKARISEAETRKDLCRQHLQNFQRMSCMMDVASVCNSGIPPCA